MGERQGVTFFRYHILVSTWMERGRENLIYFYNKLTFINTFFGEGGGVCISFQATVSSVLVFKHVREIRGQSLKVLSVQRKVSNIYYGRREITTVQQRVLTPLQGEQRQVEII
jgi:hypothetical protein